MKFESIVVIFCSTLLAITVIYANTQVDTNSHKVYNCDIADIHPDYPIEVKQKCRELRNENSTVQ